MVSSYHLVRGSVYDCDPKLGRRLGECVVVGEGDGEAKPIDGEDAEGNVEDAVDGRVDASVEESLEEGKAEVEEISLAANTEVNATATASEE